MEGDLQSPGAIPRGLFLRDDLTACGWQAGGSDPARAARSLSLQNARDVLDAALADQEHDDEPGPFADGAAEQCLDRPPRASVFLPVLPFIRAVSTSPVCHHTAAILSDSIEGLALSHRANHKSYTSHRASYLAVLLFPDDR
jgi:hypothetical protein